MTPQLFASAITIPNPDDSGAKRRMDQNPVVAVHWTRVDDVLAQDRKASRYAEI